MMARSMVRWAFGFGIAGVVAACADPKSVPGNDPETRSTATMVTWSDGKPAISINCEIPGGCQSRAIAMCKGNNYSVLNMDNMPTRGNATVVRGPASVVVRCSSSG
jgi:hypothetical protein